MIVGSLAVLAIVLAVLLIGWGRDRSASGPPLSSHETRVRGVSDIRRYQDDRVTATVSMTQEVEGRRTTLQYSASGPSAAVSSVMVPHLQHLAGQLHTRHPSLGYASGSDVYGTVLGPPGIAQIAPASPRVSASPASPVGRAPTSAARVAPVAAQNIVVDVRDSDRW